MYCQPRYNLYFGCGHSGLLAQDQFFRAGGLGNVFPILHEPLMLHLSASKSSFYEKQTDYINNFINDYQFKENDLFILVSTSGKNAVPVEVAKHIKTKTPTKLITISAFAYQKLSSEVIANWGDVNLNNCCVIGDASLSVANTGFGPTSTINSAFILNVIISQGIVKCLENDTAVDVFESGNIEGSQVNNEKVLKKYKMLLNICKI
ncbi:sugar isomerase domain-containing protein [Spiroplasma clarkii]|uniref:sugar isomerase domain-containing protein n=1 Tax=Spiroplasma clarkii TaxID=2139 RepID=UPI0011BADD15|nr:sugar isomerase domain-containing protein [Spiroplasma clarkii]